MGITAGAKAPATQAIWNRASNREKKRPWLASGASRWTRESKASLATAALTAMPSDNRTAPVSPPASAPSSAVAQPSTKAPSMIDSSAKRWRMWGATSAPRPTPAPAATPTAPKCQAGEPGSPEMSMPRTVAAAPPMAAPAAETSRPSSPPRKSNSSTKVTKPTTPRRMAMAEPDSRMVMVRSAAFSTGVGGLGATDTRGSEKVKATATA